MCSIICAFIFAAICGSIASAKGRNIAGWSALGFVCGLLIIFGIIPLILVACLPNLNEQAAKDAYIAEENRRLREQLRQERIKGESFRQHAQARLDAHDQHLGLDTRNSGQALGAGAQYAGQLGGGVPLAGDTDGGTDMPKWYYGREGRTMGPVKRAEIEELIRLQIVTRDTLVWSEELTEWQAAGQVGAFAGHFA